MTTEEAQEVESPSSQEVRQPVRRSTWHLYHVVAGRITSSYLNILLILMPLGVVSGFLGLADVVVFPLNLLAMVPLMAWITFSIGQLATSVGYFADELLKATLGSAIEMLVREIV
jgi:Ca2+:H+ antiporter